MITTEMPLPTQSIPSDFDERSVLRDATDRLTNSSHRELHHLGVRLDGTFLHITGRVHSYTLKQLAQEHLLTVDGIDRIVNEIEVVER